MRDYLGSSDNEMEVDSFISAHSEVEAIPAFLHIPRRAYPRYRTVIYTPTQGCVHPLITLSYRFRQRIENLLLYKSRQPIYAG
jgi:hypothetical protein